MVLLAQPLVLVIKGQFDNEVSAEYEADSDSTLRDAEAALSMQLQEQLGVNYCISALDYLADDGDVMSTLLDDLWSRIKLAFVRERKAAAFKQCFGECLSIHPDGHKPF